MFDSKETSLDGFYYDRHLRIYRRSEIDTFNYSDGEKEESYIEVAIKKSSDLSDDSEELMSYAKDWPSFYHLGVGRSAICKALDQFKNRKILEIGSGCGAITRYLAEMACSVDAIEGSLKRAGITSARCRDLNNVRVFAANAQQINFAEKYDVVTLIGVLEYAPVFSNPMLTKEEAVGHILFKARTLLNENGVLIIAIENKYGLKYWNGCPEEHTGIMYDGIHGYPIDRSPITFSRCKLAKLLTEAGFIDCQFYFCFPDYKFARTIISENANCSDDIAGWIKTPFPGNGLARKYTFHEGLALRTLCEDGLADYYANAFLVVASNRTLQRPDWALKYFSLNRKKAFRTITTAYIAPERCIEKKRIIPAKGPANLHWLEKEITHSEYTDKWHNGRLWLNNLMSAVWNDKYMIRIVDIIKEYNAYLLKEYFVGLHDNDGFPLVNGNALDFMISNIIVDKENRKMFFDKEWVVNAPIPADFVVWRCLLSDLVEPNLPWFKKLRANPNKLVFRIMEAVYPNYNRARHAKNAYAEKMLQQAIGMQINNYAWNSYSERRNYFWQIAFWLLGKCPNSSKKKIQMLYRIIMKWKYPAR
jgi:SAM-dependent methyltransferase